VVGAVALEEQGDPLGGRKGVEEVVAADDRRRRLGDGDPEGRRGTVDGADDRILPSELASQVGAAQPRRRR